MNVPRGNLSICSSHLSCFEFISLPNLLKIKRRRNPTDFSLKRSLSLTYLNSGRFLLSIIAPMFRSFNLSRWNLWKILSQRTISTTRHRMKLILVFFGGPYQQFPTLPWRLHWPPNRCPRQATQLLECCWPLYLFVVHSIMSVWWR